MAERIEEKGLEKEITLGHIVKYIKKYWGRIFCFAFFSMVIAVLIIAIAYFLLPKETSYVSTIHLQLPTIKGVRTYPNGKRFSTNDIFSVSVLKKVYDNHNLQNKIKFDKFRELFYLTGLDVERAKVSASFREKLNNKKITVIELKELEAEYLTSLQQLDNGSIGLAMTPSMLFTEQEMIKILNEIPRVWFEIYSKQEAKIFPEIETVSLLKDLHKNLNTEGKMLTYDKTRRICNNLQRTCDYLEEMTAGTKMALPTGEFLGDLQKRLSNFTSQRIQILLLVVRELPEYQHPFDKIAITARIMEYDKKIKLEKARYDALLDAVSILTADGKRFDNMPAAVAKGSDYSSSSNITLDSQFLSSLESLIRKALAVNVREEYANKALDIKREIARLESEKEHYLMMFRKNADPAIFKPINKEQMARMEATMFTELIELCGKINQFRDMVFKEYIQDRGFYATSGRVEKFSELKIPFSRIALGVIAVVMLLNVIYAAKLFYTSFSKGLLDE